MTDATMQDKHRVIHRYAMNGGVRCGATPDEGRTIKINHSGVMITCEGCEEKPIDRRAALAQLQAAAARYRVS